MSYFATHSGRKIDIKTISVDDICLDDIAHHLSNIQRFGGALPFGSVYSVAQHSMIVTTHAYGDDKNEVAARHALLHDATEAYLGDIVTGLKELLPDYRKIEKRVEAIIFEKYNIDTSYKELIKEIDTRLVLDEAKEFVYDKLGLYEAQLPGIKPLNARIDRHHKPDYTKQWFLRWCKEFNIED